MKNEKIKELLNNKKNTRFYEFQDQYECGLVLSSAEVKSILNYRISMGGSYGWIRRNELWLRGLVPNREIKMLLNRWEIDRIIKNSKEKKLLMIPTRIYLKNHRIKVTICLAKRINYTSKQKLESIRKKDDKKLKKYSF